ncbi:unnamed protein product [Polarella glacialis]|uniref:Uncharacterized protein n=2 Tax=Polarella glacialis TaxID=89957 RepID=A0A813KRZ4_POLGL|nr:unnamed protein product [Polarella glacialis]
MSFCSPREVSAAAGWAEGGSVLRAGELLRADELRCEFGGAFGEYLARLQDNREGGSSSTEAAAGEGFASSLPALRSSASSRPPPLSFRDWSECKVEVFAPGEGPKKQVSGAGGGRSLVLSPGMESPRLELDVQLHRSGLPPLPSWKSTALLSPRGSVPTPESRCDSRFESRSETPLLLTVRSVRLPDVAAAPSSGRCTASSSSPSGKAQRSSSKLVSELLFSARARGPSRPLSFTGRASRNPEVHHFDPLQGSEDFAWGVRRLPN